MIIGINAAAAIKQLRTGVEEYAYQLIKHLTMLPEAGEHRFLLYVPSVLAKRERREGLFDFPLPPNFEVKILKWPLPMWTQLRLAGEMMLKKPEALFIPVHILPFFYPKNSVVALHGLEYEYFPEYYPLFFRKYLQWSTKQALKKARKIIAVSENTKNDLVEIYGASPENIEVIHHGIEPGRADVKSARGGRYLLYIGRIELKKNLLGILEAYKILKQKYKIPHELVLAGKPGYGYEKIKIQMDILRQSSGYKIRELGYVGEEQKWELLAGADVFLFPSFYEGFGIPVLEAQTAGAPVVTADNSCLSEVAGKGALYADAKNPEATAAAVYNLIDDKGLRDKLIQLGFENVRRFGWEKCARKTLEIITG